MGTIYAFVHGPSVGPSPDYFALLSAAAVQIAHEFGRRLSGRHRRQADPEDRNFSPLSLRSCRRSAACRPHSRQAFAQYSARPSCIGATDAMGLELSGPRREARRRCSCQSSGAISTRALDGGVGLESRNHPVSPFDGVFVACWPFGSSSAMNTYRTATFRRRPTVPAMIMGWSALGARSRHMWPLIAGDLRPG